MPEFVPDVTEAASTDAAVVFDVGELLLDDRLVPLLLKLP